jgi:hypothetical protein
MSTARMQPGARDEDGNGVVNDCRSDGAAPSQLAQPVDDEIRILDRLDPE